MAQVPTVERALVERELKLVAREFFRYARVHQKKLPAIDVVSGQDVYTLTTGDPEVDIAAIDSVFFNKVRLPAISREGLDDEYGVDWRELHGAPYMYVPETPSAIRLFPTPMDDSPGALVVTVFLMPSLSSSTGIDSLYATHFFDAIVSGVLARLYRMPSKPWSDLGQATVMRNRYHMLLNDALRFRYGGFSDRPLRVAMRKWV